MTSYFPSSFSATAQAARKGLARNVGPDPSGGLITPVPPADMLVKSAYRGGRFNRLGQRGILVNWGQDSKGFLSDD